MTTALQDAATAAVAAAFADDNTQLAAASTSVARVQAQLDQASAALVAETAKEDADQTTIAALKATIAVLEGQINPSRFAGDPGVGKLVVGASVDGGNPTDLINQFGLTSLNLFRFYREFGNPPSDFAAMAARCATGNTYLVTSTKIPNSTDGHADFAGVAAGHHDAFFTDRLDALTSAKANSAFIVNHEPENDIQPTGSFTTAAFAAGQKHIADICADYPTIAFTTAIMGSKINPVNGGSPAILDAMYPDPTIYKLVGQDHYNQFYVGGNIAWHSVAELMGADQKILHDHFGDVVLALFECGVRVDPAHPGAAADFLRTLFALGGYALISYFFSKQNSPHGTWAWTSKTDERQSVLGGELLTSDHAVVRVAV